MSRSWGLAHGRSSVNKSFYSGQYDHNNWNCYVIIMDLQMWHAVSLCLSLHMWDMSPDLKKFIASFHGFKELIFYSRPAI